MNFLIYKYFYFIDSNLCYKIHGVKINTYIRDEEYVFAENFIYLDNINKINDFYETFDIFVYYYNNLNK